MKVGDLVNFVSQSWVTDRYYPNPGVVHKIQTGPSALSDKPVTKATILWSNATITTEHICFLEVINDS